MSSYSFRPRPPDLMTAEHKRLQEEWNALSPEAQVEHLLSLSHDAAMELVDAFLLRNPDKEEARRLLAVDLAQRGDWPLLCAIAREAVRADQEPFDPYAQLLADLHELKQVWRDPIRAGLVEHFIAETNARWKRPANYQGMTFE